MRRTAAALLITLVSSCADEPSREPPTEAGALPMDAAAPAMADARSSIDARSSMEASIPDASAKTSLQLAAESPDCIVSKLPIKRGYAAFFEFCVDDELEQLDEVRGLLAPVIDEVEFQRGGGGMIRCQETDVLIYGIPLDVPVSILCTVTQLKYVERVGLGFVP